MIDTINSITYCDDVHYEVNEVEFSPEEKLTKILCKIDTEFSLDYYFVKDINVVKDHIIYSPYFGKYILNIGLTDNEKFKYFKCFGRGNYPYSIEREYEAEKHLDEFIKTAAPDKIIDYDFSNYLKYTFGLEFETSCGYISEEDCFKKGLIPLRDGSIGGIEYSTVVLEGNKGINLLREEVEILKNTTFFDKECSLHMHLGGFPVKPIHIFTFYTLWTYLQEYIIHFIPDYSFTTSKYKKNCKDYCKKVPSMDNFGELYQYYAEDNYLGSLYQPHIMDIDKEAKWHIKGRYYNCNIINMLCYNKAKTIEFRFLRPTYNFRKITTWMLIFNAILLKAESLVKNYEINSSEIATIVVSRMFRDSPSTIFKNIFSIYPENIQKRIFKDINAMRYVIEMQRNVGDYCGMRIDIEDKYLLDE